MLNASPSLPGARSLPVSLVIRPLCTSQLSFFCDLSVCVCVSVQRICSLSVKRRVLYAREGARGALTGSLSRECIMFPVNAPSAEQEGPCSLGQLSGAVRCCAGTIHQEFGSTDTAVGLIPTPVHLYSHLSSRPGRRRGNIG